MTGKTAQKAVTYVGNHSHLPPHLRPQNRNTHSTDDLEYPAGFHSDGRRPVQVAVQIIDEQTNTQPNEDVPHSLHTSLVRRKG